MSRDLRAEIGRRSVKRTGVTIVLLTKLRKIGTANFGQENAFRARFARGKRIHRRFGLQKPAEIRRSPALALAAWPVPFPFRPAFERPQALRTIAGTIVRLCEVGSICSCSHRVVKLSTPRGPAP